MSILLGSMDAAAAAAAADVWSRGEGACGDPGYAGRRKASRLAAAATAAAAGELELSCDCAPPACCGPVDAHTVEALERFSLEGSLGELW